MKNEFTMSECEANLKNTFAKWGAIYLHGGSDPFWEDGVNLNLLRNHIIHYKQLMGEIRNEIHGNTLKIDGFFDYEFPSIYYRETPKEMPRDYMARSDEIRCHAQEALEIYTNNENYQWCLSELSKATDKEIKASCIQTAVCFVEGLRIAIDEDDLLSLRRHEHYETYLDSFSSCRKKLEALYELRNDTNHCA